MVVCGDLQVQEGSTDRRVTCSCYQGPPRPGLRYWFGLSTPPSILLRLYLLFSPNTRSFPCSSPLPSFPLPLFLRPPLRRAHRRQGPRWAYTDPPLLADEALVWPAVLAGVRHGLSKDIQTLLYLILFLLLLCPLCPFPSSFSSRRFNGRRQRGSLSVKPLLSCGGHTFQSKKRGRQ